MNPTCNSFVNEYLLDMELVCLFYLSANEGEESAPDNVHSLVTSQDFFERLATDRDRNAVAGGLYARKISRLLDLEDREPKLSACVRRAVEERHARFLDAFPED